MQENFPINFPRRCDDSAPFPCFATCFKILKRGVPKKRGVPTLESNVDRNKYPKSRRFRISTLVTSDRRCSSNLIYKKENERSRVHECITRKYFQKARETPHWKSGENPPHPRVDKFTSSTAIPSTALLYSRSFYILFRYTVEGHATR